MDAHGDNLDAARQARDIAAVRRLTILRDERLARERPERLVVEREWMEAQRKRREQEGKPVKIGPPPPLEVWEKPPLPQDFSDMRFVPLNSVDDKFLKWSLEREERVLRPHKDFEAVVFVSHRWDAPDVPDETCNDGLFVKNVMANGFVIPEDEDDRHVCNYVVHPIIWDGSQILDVGIMDNTKQKYKRIKAKKMDFDKIGVFYDYACLPQKPRSYEEEGLFKRRLGQLSSLISSGLSAVVIVARDDYDSRTWCVAELMLSLLATRTIHSSKNFFIPERLQLFQSILITLTFAVTELDGKCCREFRKGTHNCRHKGFSVAMECDVCRMSFKDVRTDGLTGCSLDYLQLSWMAAAATLILFRDTKVTNGNDLRPILRMFHEQILRSMNDRFRVLTMETTISMLCGVHQVIKCIEWGGERIPEQYKKNGWQKLLVEELKDFVNKNDTGYTFAD